MQTSSTTPNKSPQIMTLFPTLDSPEEVLELAKSKVTSVERNELHSLFMTYHNTLLHRLLS